MKLSFTKSFNKIAFTVLLVILLMTFWFLYNNFYIVYTQTDEIVMQKLQVAPISFKQETWDKVIKNLDVKLTPKQIPEHIKDPFKP